MKQLPLGRALSLAGLLALAGALLGLACGRYESCDPGQVLQFNVCFPGVVDGGRPDVAAAGGSPGDAGTSEGGGGMCADKAAGFGETCTADAQCRCSTDLCAIVPGQTSGFCTRSGCMKDPTICPTGWSCYDASAFQPGYSLCVNL
jgi:hypothetical protein